MMAKTALILILIGLFATGESALAMGMGGGGMGSGMGGGMGGGGMGGGWGGYSNPGNNPGYNQPGRNRSADQQELRQELKRLEDEYRARLDDPQATRQELRERYEEITRVKERLDRIENEDRPMSQGGSRWGGLGGLVW